MANDDERPMTRRNLGGGLSIPAAAEKLNWPRGVAAPRSRSRRGEGLRNGRAASHSAG